MEKKNHELCFFERDIRGNLPHQRGGARQIPKTPPLHPFLFRSCSCLGIASSWGLLCAGILRGIRIIMIIMKNKRFVILVYFLEMEAVE